MKTEEYKRVFRLEENHWWYLGMRKISQTLLTQVLKQKNLRILDSGCGTGGMMIYLKQFGEVWGIDVSQEALKYCQKRELKNTVQASVEKIPFPQNTFDLVTSFDVLYHQWIKSDLAALKEFYRVLKPEGYLLIRVPAYNWLRGKHDEIVATKHRYTKNELVKKVKDSGFKIRRATYANTILFPLAVVKRFLEKALPEIETSDIRPLPKIINAFLTAILYFEAKIISKFDFPFGLSLFVLAKK